MMARKVSTIADGRRRLVHAQARREELRAAREAGTLVPAKDVELRWSGIITEARTQLLGLPTRLKQRRPDVTREALIVLDELIREALEGLADGRAPNAHPRADVTNLQHKGAPDADATAAE